VVRGLGLVESVRDVEQIVIGAEGGVPIYVGQVATVKVGDAFRAAALVKGSEEAVGGVVVARYGVSTVDVIRGVKEKIGALQTGLPAGVRIVPFYDRSALIERAVGTLRRSLIEETIVVTVVNILFLLNVRSVLIVTIPLPLAVLTSFLFMYYLGISSNIMSLAGIAIAIGVLVDAAIVVTENAFRYMERHGVNTRNRARVLEAVAAATRVVGRPIFFSMTIIILAFVRADRPGGQALPAAGVHQDVLDDGGHAPVRHSGAGAVQPHHRRPHPRRGIEPHHAPADVAVPADPRMGAPASRRDAGGGRPGVRGRRGSHPANRS
jgi:copper/silver efflux system protein